MLEKIPNSIIVPPLLAKENRYFCTNSDSPVSLLFENYLVWVHNRISDEAHFVINDALIKENIYNPVKRFGNILLMESRSQFDYEDKATGLIINKDKIYLGMHLSEVNGTVEQKRAALNDNLISVGLYLAYFKSRLPASPLIGVTYEKLARASRRYGFKMAETEVPKNIQDEIQRTLTEHMGKRKMFEDPARVIFQDYDDLINRAFAMLASFN